MNDRFDNAADGVSCVTQRTDNQKEYQKRCDCFQGAYKDISEDGDTGSSRDCETKDRSEYKSDKDSFDQSNFGPFVP